MKVSAQWLYIDENETEADKKIVNISVDVTPNGKLFLASDGGHRSIEPRFSRCLHVWVRARHYLGRME